MKELKWELAPEKPGDNDSNSSRIRRWEEANPGVKLKDLPEQQAVEALAWILMLTEQLRAIFPNADAIGRIGGDEFMIFLREAGSEAQARAQLETLRNRLVQASQGKQATLRCSVGGAFARPEEDYDSLYRRADDALYAVKRNGRDGYAFYKDVR